MRHFLFCLRCDSAVTTQLSSPVTWDLHIRQPVMSCIDPPHPIKNTRPSLFQLRGGGIECDVLWYPPSRGRLHSTKEFLSNWLIFFLHFFKHCFKVIASGSKNFIFPDISVVLSLVWVVVTSAHLQLQLAKNAYKVLYKIILLIKITNSICCALLTFEETWSSWCCFLRLIIQSHSVKIQAYHILNSLIPRQWNKNLKREFSLVSQFEWKDKAKYIPMNLPCKWQAMRHSQHAGSGSRLTRIKFYGSSNLTQD
jgi:hypothetical protein